ncbi:hypothetical protein [Streptomyces sp. NPDC047009]|uniref:hypothetical protein n=1 Tax=unclassified Streptomyces TaxID=2593676 RepID=UPI0033C9D0E1
MPATDFSYVAAFELTAAMDAREVSAVEVAEVATERIERYDVDIDAICVRDFDRAVFGRV